MLPVGDLSVLNSREIEVLTLLAAGLTTNGIAAQMDLSTRTVEAHRHRVIKKLGVASTSELLLYFFTGHRTAEVLPDVLKMVRRGPLHAGGVPRGHAPDGQYEVNYFAKKHIISLALARAILREAGASRDMANELARAGWTGLPSA